MVAPNNLVQRSGDGLGKLDSGEYLSIKGLPLGKFSGITPQAGAPWDQSAARPGSVAVPRLNYTGIPVEVRLGVVIQESFIINAPHHWVTLFFLFPRKRRLKFTTR